jgi:hypothetical protein
VKAHTEIEIRLNLNNGETLHDVLRQFARDTDGWLFPQKESETYQKHIGETGGYVVCDSVKGCERAIVAVAARKSKRPNIFYVPNIVPRDCFHLTVDQYNVIGLAFARSFARWCRKNANKGRVHCSSPSKTLADIIPAEKCRKYFEQYLNCSIWNSTALPTHPSDVQKLDVFICALIRYGADVRLDEIENYLVVDRKWKPADAAWVRARIETGMDVLKVYRKF